MAIAEISNEQIKEEIKILTEMLRFEVVALLATVSGEVSMILKDSQSYLQQALIVIGFFITLGNIFYKSLHLFINKEDKMIFNYIIAIGIFLQMSFFIWLLGSQAGRLFREKKMN
jgi:hypothetical protein